MLPENRYLDGASPTAQSLTFLLDPLSAGGQTHELLPRRVSGPYNCGDAELGRTIVKGLCEKLADAKNPRYILTQPRVSYRMGRARTSEPVESKQE